MNLLFSFVLADDEQITRDGLASLSWESMGYSLDGVYSNGITVLEWCKSHPTDVVLLDIRMPGMTGLEVAKELHSMSPKTVVVLLSAYTEFSLAQEALRHGVFRYISKPLDLDELYETFSEVSKEVKKRNELHQAFQQLSVAESLRSFFSQAQTSSQKPVSIPKVSLPADLFSSPLTFVLSDEEQPLPDCLWYITMVNGYTLSVLSKTSIEDQSTKNKSNNAHYLVGTTDPPGVSHSLIIEQLLQQRDRLFIESDKVLEINPNWIPGDNPEVQAQVMQRSLDLARQFQQVDWQEWNQSFNRFIDLCIQLGVTKPTFQWTLSLLCSQIFQLLAQQGIDETMLIDFTGSEKVFTPEVLLQIQTAKRLELCKQLILERSEPAHRLLTKLLERRFEDKRLSKVVEFLEENLGKPIGLDQAAEIVGMNSSAFSRWFKEVQGRNFVDYFSQMRIHHAIKLMEDPAKKIGDIAQLCGYPNARYFAVVFRKHMGISPQEFRQTQA
jgi:two-component system response regulator YesN